mgnify:FL=1
MSTKTKTRQLTTPQLERLGRELVDSWADELTYLGQDDDSDYYLASSENWAACIISLEASGYAKIGSWVASGTTPDKHDDYYAYFWASGPWCEHPVARREDGVYPPDDLPEHIWDAVDPDCRLFRR